jgi:hypothetical protein
MSGVCPVPVRGGPHQIRSDHRGGVRARLQCSTGAGSVAVAGARVRLPHGPVPRPDHRPGEPIVGSDAGLRWRSRQRVRVVRTAAGDAWNEDAVGRRGLANESVDAAAVGAVVCQVAVRVDVRRVGGLAAAGLVVT